MANFSIVSYNVKGLGNEKKRRKIFNYLHKQKYDFVFMQETHASKNVEHIWRAEWGGKIYFANGTSASRGVALLINRNTHFVEKEIYDDPEGRFLVVALTINDIDFVFTVVYAPNADDPNFFANVFVNSEIPGGNRIIAGDFNTVLNNEKDIKGGKGYSHKRSTKYINEYIEQSEMVDIWRIRHPEQFRSTYIQKESTIASTLSERLDYILIDASLQQFVTEADIKPMFASDHAMPTVSLSVHYEKPGPGYWKLNNELLQDETFINETITVITDILSDSSMDLFKRWDLMKFSVKQCALKRSINKAKSEKAKLEALEKKLASIQKERDSLDLGNP